MKIGAALEFNLIDYPGKIAAVAFTPGCNYACPHCHAAPLLRDAGDIGEEGFFRYLDTVRNWVDGVTICGGEPTLQPGLFEFARRLKERKLAVKVDTNGSNPKVLERLLGEGLADYVAMDVKGPKFLWPATAGVEGHAEAMAESLRLVARFPEYEFRTTLAPVVRGNGEISFLTAQEMAAAARLITSLTGSGDHRYFVQKFVPRKDGLLDKRLEAFPETPRRLLEEAHAEVSKYLPKAEIRG